MSYDVIRGERWNGAVTRQQRLTALADAGHQGRVAAKCPPTLRGARGGCGTDGHMPFDRATRTIRSI